MGAVGRGAGAVKTFEPPITFDVGLPPGKQDGAVGSWPKQKFFASYWRTTH